MQVLKLSLRKAPGGVVRGYVTSVPVKAEQLLSAGGYERRFRAQLADCLPCDRLDLVIDSAGGALASAEALTKAIADLAKCPVRVLIDGQCASAATLVAMAADKGQLMITPRSSVFVHEPKAYGIERVGGALRLYQKVGRVVAVSTLVTVYRSRLKWPRREIRKMIHGSRRFTAAEAVEAGFCDAVCERWIFEK